MQKIISLLTALMIFAFSFLGEEVHASSNSRCSETAYTRSIDLDQGGVNSTTESFQKAPSTERGFELHDCHFGHCAFTLFHPARIGSRIPQAGDSIQSFTALPQPGFRSETIRPPAIA